MGSVCHKVAIYDPHSLQMAPENFNDVKRLTWIKEYDCFHAGKLLLVQSDVSHRFDQLIQDPTGHSIDVHLIRAVTRQDCIWTHDKVVLEGKGALGCTEDQMFPSVGSEKGNLKKGTGRQRELQSRHTLTIKHRVNKVKATNDL